MTDVELKQILLMPIKTGYTSININMAEQKIYTSGCCDPDMSDIAVEYYKVIYSELNIEFSRKLGSPFSGDTMNSLSTIKKTASETAAEFWEKRYHCLANFWVLPANVGRSLRACNKAGYRTFQDYMDRFLNGYLKDESFYNRFKDKYDKYTAKFPKESFVKIHMLEKAYVEGDNIIMYSKNNEADEIICEMWKRVEKRADYIANSSKKKELISFLSKHITSRC